MKKLAIGAVAILSALAITTSVSAAPVSSSANAVGADRVIQPEVVASKVVDVYKYYPIGETIPSTHYYEDGVGPYFYVGTIPLVDTTTVGNEIRAHYRGTVYRVKTLP